ncbi:GDSL esterase/lipase CPRD49 [Linum perenne]
MVGPARPQIVLFGSSIVQLSFGNGGWGAILSDIYSRKADVVLRGYSGWNSRRALQVLDQIFPKDAAVQQPSLVIVYFGGNDSIHPHKSGLGPHVPLQEYVDNMKKIALHLQSLSEKIRLIFLTSPPVDEDLMDRSCGGLWDMDRNNESCRIYSEACMKLCDEMGVKGVDLWTSIQQHTDKGHSCFTDGIHLSAEGSKVVVKQILKAIKEADWEPSLDSRSLPTEFPEDSPYDPVSHDGNTVNVSDFDFNKAALWE